MGKILVQTTVALLLPLSGFADTHFSYGKGQGPAAQPVAPSTEVTTTVNEPDQVQVMSEIAQPNRIGYKSYDDGRYPVRVRPAKQPEGCGFYRGKFRIENCKTEAGSSTLYCAANYINPDPQNLAQTMSSLFSSNKSEYSFSINDVTTAAYLCAARASAREKQKFGSNHKSKVLGGSAIAQGLQLCDPSFKLYRSKNEIVRNREFMKAAGEASRQALRTEAEEFLAKKFAGQTAEQVLADCSANNVVAKTVKVQKTRPAVKSSAPAPAEPIPAPVAPAAVPAPVPAPAPAAKKPVETKPAPKAAAPKEELKTTLPPPEPVLKPEGRQ